MSTPQQRADRAAEDLITAVAEMAIEGDSELVVLMRGHVTNSAPGEDDLLFSWEWFCRPEASG